MREKKILHGHTSHRPNTKLSVNKANKDKEIRQKLFTEHRESVNRREVSKMPENPNNKQLAKLKKIRWCNEGYRRKHQNGDQKYIQNSRIKIQIKRNTIWKITSIN